MAAREAPRGGARWCGSRATPIQTSIVDVLGAQELLVAGGSDDHGRGGDAVDATGDAGGGVEEGGDGIVVEEGLLAGATGGEAELDVVSLATVVPPSGVLTRGPWW